MNIDSNEQQIAAYLGFNDVSKLRILTLSWPVINAFLDFEIISKNMNKKTAFRLLYDNESQFRNVQWKKKWKINFAGPEDDNYKAKASRWPACILLELEANVQKMKTLSPELNAKTQEELVDLYKGCNHDERIPIFEFPDPSSDAPTAAGVLQHPVLGLYVGESRLERINRC